MQPAKYSPNRNGHHTERTAEAARGPHGSAEAGKKPDDPEKTRTVEFGNPPSQIQPMQRRPPIRNNLLSSNVQPVQLSPHGPEKTGTSRGKNPYDPTKTRTIRQEYGSTKECAIRQKPVQPGKGSHDSKKTPDAAWDRSVLRKPARCGKQPLRPRGTVRRPPPTHARPTTGRSPSSAPPAAVRNRKQSAK